VDILGALTAAHHLRGLVSEVRRGPQQDWEKDESAFLTHFGAPFDEYALIVSHMSDDQRALLEKTLAVNPEAAVLWVLAMEETG
jgi:hypothetical protein